MAMDYTNPHEDVGTEKQGGFAFDPTEVNDQQLIGDGQYGQAVLSSYQCCT